MRTKGDKSRTIHIPVSLMVDLWDYVIHERNATIRQYGTAPKTLFVTAKGAPWSIRTSLNNQLNRLDLSFSCHPHILRHTYATHTLKSLMSRESTTFNPLIYVRDRLGHSSITTTEKYLHFLDDIEDDLRTRYQEEIEETAKEVVCA